MTRNAWARLQDSVAGTSSAESWVRESLDAIHHGDRDIGSFLHVAGESAAKRARSVDADRPRGLLCGLPVAVKDNLVWAEGPTTAGSRMLQGYIPPYSATAVERLEAAGAVIVGKTNMDEFSMGSSNENSAFGPVRNPFNRNHVPGGSSGGSAAAVAAGLVPAALGSDTGGSIRQPAAFCGVYGLKPTYGRVSRHGLIAFASSLDQVGPLASDLDVLAALYTEIAGGDSCDQTLGSGEVSPVKPVAGRVKGLRIGVAAGYLNDADGEIAAAVERAASALSRAGAELQTIELPDPQTAMAAYYLLANAEASSNLARYDGVRYGFREPADDLLTQYSRTRELGFGREVKRRILLGTFALSAGYADQYYNRALAARVQFQRAYKAQADSVDVWLLPTTPTTAFKLGEKTADPVAMYQSDLFTVSANLAGLPAMNVPAGLDLQGLPVGIQIMAPQWEEERLFDAAAALAEAGFVYSGPPS